MIPKAGQSLLGKSRVSSLKPLITASNQYVKRTIPLVPALAVRSFSAQIPKQAEALSIKTTSQPTQKKKSPLDTLNEFKKTGYLKGAIRAVQLANESGQATPALYIALVDLLRDSPFDVEKCATVAHWFYSPDSNIPSEALHDIKLWKDVLKLGFYFGSTYRSEDLRALVDRFTELFDLTTLDDQEAWRLLIRAYGILSKPKSLNDCLDKVKNSQDNQLPFHSSTLLSYAAIQSYDDVEKLLEKLKNNNALTKHTLLKLIRCCGFNGDIVRTSKYMDMCYDLFPKTKRDNSMLLIAHKVALQNILQDLVNTRGVHGLGLKPTQSPALDELHASWSELTKDMFKDDSKPVDITDCNIVLEYLTLSNRIDPIQFPMEKAEAIFNSYMPAHMIQPNEASHNIMLVGYANSQQYNDGTHNVRLDKALEVVSKMQVNRIDTLNHRTFHALFRACIPHRFGKYYFDHFRLSSLLPARPFTHNRFRLDPRIFEIEQIMNEAKIPHDRYTLTTMMTCLAAGGQYKALQNRWNSIKLHGLRRDVGMYRHMFALASLNPTASKRALVVIRNEMNREISKKLMNWETYTAMLDCCVTAQSSLEAEQIMKEMRHIAEVFNKKKPLEYHDKYPYPDEPDYYAPLLRTAVALPELNADRLVQEIHDKQVIYNRGIWEALLSKEAMEGNVQGIQQLFNKYTMARFEKDNKIPVPVRESKPVVPFLTAPYNTSDIQFIDVYISSLIDSQDISLVMDVLRTLSEQTSEISLSRRSLHGIYLLARQEKSKDELKWFRQEILPKVPQHKFIKILMSQIDLVLK